MWNIFFILSVNIIALIVSASITFWNMKKFAVCHSKWGFAILWHNMKYYDDIMLSSLHYLRNQVCLAAFY